MIRKTPSDFGSHEDWLTHVREHVPAPEQPYARAFGRTELFRRFYQTQGLPVPTQFSDELERVMTLQDPERTAALEALSEAMFRSLTKLVFNRARLARSDNDAQSLPSSREQVSRLLSHLAQNNPYFALWVTYKKSVSSRATSEQWSEYLDQELGPERAEKIAFAQAMAKLDKLLTVFRDNNVVLPSLAFERIWFLHAIRGPERMAQTRAVLGMLTAELAACTSA